MGERRGRLTADCTELATELERGIDARRKLRSLSKASREGKMGLLLRKDRSDAAGENAERW
jgi:hypothetical protein